MIERANDAATGPGPGPDPQPGLGLQNAADILESLSDAFVAIDREWRYTYVNAGAERIFNRRRAEMLGRTVWDLFSQQGTTFETGCRRAMNERVAVHFEGYYPALHTWFENTVYPSNDGIVIHARDITERKRAEEALREQERFVRQIVELTPIVLTVVDLTTGRHTYISRDVVGLHGYSLDEIEQMKDPSFELLHPDDVSLVKENFVRLQHAAADQINECEYRVRHRDGQWRWLSSRSMPFARSDDGVVRHAVSATIDITERNRVEARLAFHADLLEHVHDAIVATDESLIVTAWNRAAEQTYGWRIDEVIGRDVREVVRSEFNEADRIELLRSIAERGHGEVETFHHRKDGTRIQVEGSIIALRDASHRVTGYVTAHRDITARKLAAEELAKRESLLNDAQRLAHVGSWEWDTSSDTAAWSDEMYRICGVERPHFDVTLEAVRQLIHPGDREAFDEILERAVQERVPYTFEHRIIRPDGTARTLQSRGAVVADEHDRAIRVFGTAQDITERTQAEEALRRAHDELEQRIVERTIELSSTNEELRTQVAERARAEAAATGAREEAERRAREAEEAQSTLHTILEYAPEGITLAGGPPDFPIIANSRHGDTLLGRAPGAMQRIAAGAREEAFGLQTPDSLRRPGPEELPLYRASRYGEVVENEEWIIERPDGSRIHTLSNVAPIRDSEGRIIGAINCWRDITERKLAVAELRRLTDELAADLEAMNRLHELSTRLLATDRLQSLLEEVLAATIDLQHADFGNVQLRNPQTNALEIVAQRGFDQEFLDHFSAVNEESAACGRAMRRRERIIIEDVEIDPEFEPHRPVAARAGFRAVQSTPLFSRNGELLGMLSTHFRQPHRPSERELRLTDLYVLQAASMVDRKRVEETLRRSETYLAEGQKLTHTGSWCWNVASGEMYWSREQFQILGFDPEQSAPSLAMTLQPIHPDDRSFVQQSLDKAVRERTDAEWDCRVVVGDGTIRHVHTTAHPVVNAGKLTEFLGTTMDITERKKEEEARKDLGRRLLNAQEDERRRISRELHDQLGQQLSALKWRLEALRREHAAQPHLDAQLASLQAIASQLDADVDFIAWQLRPTGLDDLGLAVALKHYVASWSEHFHIQAQLHVGGIDPNSLTDEIQTALYRILQESLNNVAKHSGATHVQILLEGHSDRVSLIVEDDGRGFDTGGAFAYGAKQLGLVGMRERAALLDGTLDVESPGRGTTVVARIPTQVRPHGKPGP